MLHLFNALSGKKEPFVPTNSNDVKIYCSSPPLYNISSLTINRTYVIWDVLQRLLRYHFGYPYVRTVMCVIDLDDTLIAKGGLKVARKFEHQFFATLKQLNVERPDFAPRLTDCENEAIMLRNHCLVKEIAYYEPGFSTTYFSVDTYLKKWGNVFTGDEEKSEFSQIADKDSKKMPIADKAGKWDPRDFTLWYSSKKWANAAGKEEQGMPERSLASAAMARFYFSDSIDIYLGNVDLHYREYEKEIALIHEDSDKKSVCYCLFVGTGNMSKTVNDLLNEGYFPLAIRYYFLKNPYGKLMTCHKDEMEEAHKSYVQFIYYINRLKTYVQEAKPKEIYEDFDEIWYDGYGSLMETYTLNEVKKEIDTYLKDDLNVPKALEIIEDYVKRFSDPIEAQIPYEWLRYCLNYILWLVDNCFGLIPQPSDSLFLTNKKVKDELQNLALRNEAEEKERQQMRDMRYVKGVTEA